MPSSLAYNEQRRAKAKFCRHNFPKPPVLEIKILRHEILRHEILRSEILRSEILRSEILRAAIVGYPILKLAFSKANRVYELDKAQLEVDNLWHGNYATPEELIERAKAVVALWAEVCPDFPALDDFPQEWWKK